MFCCVAFMISGIMMAIQTNNEQPLPITGYKTLSAAMRPQVYMPAFNSVKGSGSLNLPETPAMGFVNSNKSQDTVIITKTDTIERLVTKVIFRKVPVPSKIVKTNAQKVRIDTIQVPVYYPVKQVGIKESPTDKCISVFELRKVDEICPETTNSYAKSANERYGMWGD